MALHRLLQCCFCGILEVKGSIESVELATMFINICTIVNEQISNVSKRWAKVAQCTSLAVEPHCIICLFLVTIIIVSYLKDICSFYLLKVAMSALRGLGAFVAGMLPIIEPFFK